MEMVNNMGLVSTFEPKLGVEILVQEIENNNKQEV